MRITKLVLICMCCVMVAPTVWAQTASSQAKPGILGYLDPHTGAFRPVPAVAEEDSALAAATTVTGTITVTLTITLKTTGLTNVTCSEEVSVFDGTTSPSSFTESNTVAATTTGATKTCKLSIPYAWSLTTAASDNMTTSYTVFGTTGTTGLATRSSSHFPLDTRKVPANGAITALTAAVTL
jgi:hypothetical protein